MERGMIMKTSIREKRIIQIAAYLSFILLIPLTSAEDSFYDSYHILTISIDFSETEDVSFIDYELNFDGAYFKSEEGIFTVQIVSEDSTVLYENLFMASNIITYEPDEGCFDEQGNLICDLSPIISDETTEIIYIPSIAGERYIQILKDGEIKLEIDIFDPPLDYQDTIDSLLIDISYWLDDITLITSLMDILLNI